MSLTATFNAGLTLGGTVTGDPVKVCHLVLRCHCPLVVKRRVFYQDIIKVAFENGINMFDTAEEYANM